MVTYPRGQQIKVHSNRCETFPRRLKAMWHFRPSFFTNVRLIETMFYHDAILILIIGSWFSSIIQQQTQISPGELEDFEFDTGVIYWRGSRVERRFMNLERSVMLGPAIPSFVQRRPTVGVWRFAKDIDAERCSSPGSGRSAAPAIHSALNNLRLKIAGLWMNWVRNL